jgi:hypothetical protein
MVPKERKSHSDTGIVDWFPQEKTKSGVVKGAEYFAAELRSSVKMREIIQNHGGFCFWILREMSLRELLNSGEKGSVLLGSFELNYLDKSLHSRMAAAGVSVYEVVSAYLDSMESCPCIGIQKCHFCGSRFIPTGWAYVELRLGRRVCPICAKLATDGTQILPWLGKDKAEIAYEVSFGYELQGFLSGGARISFEGPPQRDSERAAQSMRLHAASTENFERDFLAVALRPKELQVRLAFGFWEQWLMQCGDNSYRSADDGHVCLSEGEETICNFLSRHGVPHTREPRYLDYVDADVAALVRHFKGDFEIAGTIFEFAGLAGAAEYDKKMAIKLNIAARLGMPIRVIYPADLAKLELIFQEYL